MPNNNIAALIEEKIAKGREYRNITTPMETRKDGEQCEVRGYAATFMQPYTLYSADGFTFREQIDPKAFENCDMSDVVMQYNHKGRVFARTRNKTLEVGTDDHGLCIRAQLGGTELGRQVYAEISGGYSDRMSFGFIVEKDERVVTEDHENGTIDILRTITAFRKLYDVSVVSLPANDATEISARNWADGAIEAHREEQRKKALDKLNLRLKLMEVSA